MRIVDAYRNSPANTHAAKPATASDAARAKGANTEEAPSAASAGVKVSVSAEARRLAQKAGDDDARVERLREAVSDGSFKVDVQAVARKIVEAGG